MEPTQRPRGSFGMPPEMQKKLNDTEQKRYEEKMQQATSPQQAAAAPVTHIADPDNTAEREADEVKEQESRLSKLKLVIENDLGVTVTEADLKAYIFRGALRKEVVLVQALGLKGIFTTLTTHQYQEIDGKMAALRSDTTLTSNGLASENAIISLSYGWLEIDGKSLGSSPEEREANIRKMGGTLVESVSETFTNYSTLIKIALQDKGLVKKS